VSGENGQNTWGVEFSLVIFLEKILKGNSNVTSVRRYRDIVFDVIRTNQRDTLTILCINKYSASLDVVMRAIEEFPSVSIIFIGGKWNKSTREAREYCEERKIGLFNSGELPIALRQDEYWRIRPTRPTPPRSRRRA
jgi:hypothetical protein